MFPSHDREDELLEEANRIWNYWRQDKAHNKQPCVYMKVEDKAAGQGLIQVLKKRNHVSVVPVPRGANQNKYVRFCNVKHELKQGKVFIPDHTAKDANGNKITEIPLWLCKDRSANVHWVPEFLAELANVNVGVLLDQEAGYDDQLDVLMDALDDFCLENSNFNVSAMTSNLSHILGY